MSIPYVIILSDSEDEIDLVQNPIILSDSEEEFYDLENPEEEDPEEEDPEEEIISETPPPSPILKNSSNFCGAYTIRTARKSVLTHRTTSVPEPTIPTIDPYYHQQTNKSWTWIADTLETWRLEEGFPSVTEVGESSQQNYPSTGEAPHLSIPPMIAKMTAQENKLSLIEDAIGELPTAEVHEELQQQFTTMEQNMGEVRDVTNDLLDMGEETVNDLNIVRNHLNVAQGRIEENGGRIAANAWRANDLDRRINRLEVDMNQFDAMATMLRDLDAYIHMHDITLNNKGKK